MECRHVSAAAACLRRERTSGTPTVRDWFRQMREASSFLFLRLRVRPDP
jgi:hypothetical protein